MMSSKFDETTEELEALDLTSIIKRWSHLAACDKSEETHYFSKSLFESPRCFEEILSRLDKLPFPVMLYKSKTKDFYFIGLGEAESLSSAPQSVDKIYFGGQSFNPKSDLEKAPEWQDFGQKLFMAPKVGILFGRQDHLWTQKIFVQETQRPSELQSFLANVEEKVAQDLSADKELSPHTITEIPNKETWAGSIQAALEEFKKENSSLKKIVLSRKLVLKKTGPEEKEEAEPLLDIYLDSKDSYFYLFRPSSRSYFLSVTPERLFTLKNGKHLLVDAIAGTRKRGDNEQEDKRLSRELCESDKDRREHRFVKNHVREKLSTLGDPLLKGDENLLKLNHVQHLYSEFELTLKNAPSTEELINLLHPTPAVGGVPTDVAHKKIEQRETFSRGWYAAPLGILTPNFCEMIVGIRSGLKVKHENQSFWHIYAGAGIVPGSHPGPEWEETQQKMQNFLKYWENSPQQIRQNLPSEKMQARV